MTTVLESLNQALHEAMENNDSVYMIGEDLLDPYGGAFKVAKGLSSKYPKRVLSSPISEAGITGIAAGMALRGLFPVVEIMFGDFVTLIADQVINNIAKFSWMFNQQVSIPIVIRAPMGGHRGYGPTHSQSLEKLFLGVPGLRVLAPCAFGSPSDLLSKAITQDQEPVIFIENKRLYLKKVNDPDILSEFNFQEISVKASYAPSYQLSIKDAPTPQLTIAAYGDMASMAVEAAKSLAYEHEIFAEVVIPTQLSPFEIEPILNSLRKTGRLLAAEEGTYNLGWGAEIAALSKEQLGSQLLEVKRVAAQNSPVPASLSLEKEMLPSVENIVQIAQTMVK